MTYKYGGFNSGKSKAAAYSAVANAVSGKNVSFPSASLEAKKIHFDEARDILKRGNIKYRIELSKIIIYDKENNRLGSIQFTHSSNVLTKPK